MQIPVLIYSSVIISMVLAALNWNTFVANVAFQLVLTGAISFMLSDMIIALNKFKSPVSNAAVWGYGFVFIWAISNCEGC